LQLLQAAITLIQQHLILRSIEKVTDTIGKTGTIDILDMHNLDWSKVKMGIISADCGRASMGFLEKAMQLALNHEITAMVMLRLIRSHHAGGYTGLGHLEYMAQATSTKIYATMLATGNLRCVHLTTHYSLREACNHVKKEFILERLKLTDTSFRQWGFRPAGDRRGGALIPTPAKNGMFGREEIDEIAPAVN